MLPVKGLKVGRILYSLLLAEFLDFTPSDRPAKTQALAKFASQIADTNIKLFGREVAIFAYRNCALYFADPAGNRCKAPHRYCVSKALSRHSSSATSTALMRASIMDVSLVPSSTGNSPLITLSETMASASFGCRSASGVSRFSETMLPALPNPPSMISFYADTRAAAGLSGSVIILTSVRNRLSGVLARQATHIGRGSVRNPGLASCAFTLATKSCHATSLILNDCFSRIKSSPVDVIV
jgi:hypothetical protein